MSKHITEEHSRFHIHQGEGGERFIICNPMRELNGLIETVDRIINSTDEPYKLAHGRLGDLRQTTMLGLSLKSFSGYRRLYDGDLSYSPDLQLFFECVKSYPQPFWDHPPESNFFVEHASRFVEVMRKEGKKINIKKKINDWKKGPLKNQARLTAYLDALFSCYARIVVIRIDFHLRNNSSLDLGSAQKVCRSIEMEKVRKMNGFYSGDEPLEIDSTTEHVTLEIDSTIEHVTLEIDSTIEHVTLEKIKSAYKKWSGNAGNKTSLFHDMIGHVVRYEFSKGGGYHIHAALFFDGSKRQNDAWLAESIGEYWVKTTDGQGYFFNCNRENYPESGIGVIDYYDHEKRQILYRVLGYLAKSDQHVRVKSGSKQKLFTTGKMPVAQTRKLGRPRRKDQP